MTDQECITWGVSTAPRRPGDLLTRGDVCHLHMDRAAAERCGLALGGAPELVGLAEVRPAVYRVGVVAVAHGERPARGAADPPRGAGSVRPRAGLLYVVLPRRTGQHRDRERLCDVPAGPPARDDTTRP